MRSYWGHLGWLLPTWLALHRPEPELPVAVWQVGENTCRPGGLGVNMLCCHGFRRGATQILEIKILCKIRSLNMYIICTYVPIYPLIASGWCKIIVCNAWTTMIAGTVRRSEPEPARQQTTAKKRNYFRFLWNVLKITPRDKVESLALQVHDNISHYFL